MTMDEIEKEALAKTLLETSGNKKRAFVKTGDYQTGPPPWRPSRLASSRATIQTQLQLSPFSLLLFASLSLLFPTQSNSNSNLSYLILSDSIQFQFQSILSDIILSYLILSFIPDLARPGPGPANNIIIL